MENWSYRLREFCGSHRRDIKRYGLCALLFIVALLQRVWVVAWGSLLAAAVIHAYDRWGAPYAERGRLVIKGRNSSPKP